MRAYSARAEYSQLIAISQESEISGQTFSYIDKLIEEYAAYPRSLSETSFLWTEMLLIVNATSLFFFT